MFEDSDAVAFWGGARSMLDLRTWALYYKAQCSACCFFFFRFLDAIVVLLIIVTTDRRYQICLRDASMWRSYLRRYISQRVP